MKQKHMKKETRYQKEVNETKKMKSWNQSRGDRVGPKLKKKSTLVQNEKIEQSDRPCTVKEADKY